MIYLNVEMYKYLITTKYLKAGREDPAFGLGGREYTVGATDEVEAEKMVTDYIDTDLEEVVDVIKL